MHNDVFKKTSVSNTCSLVTIIVYSACKLHLLYKAVRDVIICTTYYRCTVCMERMRKGAGKGVGGERGRGEEGERKGEGEEG